jgi:hypothetical protein
MLAASASALAIAFASIAAGFCTCSARSDRRGSVYTLTGKNLRARGQ